MKARKHLDMLRGAADDVYYGEVEGLNLSDVPAGETKLRTLIKDAKIVEKMRVKANTDFDREIKKAIVKAEKLAAKEEEKA